jgi:hypothetical protein
MVTRDELEEVIGDVVRRSMRPQTQPASSNKKADWMRMVVVAIAVGGALATLGFFLFKGDAEANVEHTQFEAVDTALEKEDVRIDKEMLKLELDHEKRSRRLERKLERIIDNQVRQSSGRRAKPDGE